MKIKPVRGLKVRNPYKPGFSHLKEEGENVEPCQHWYRRLKFGECELVEENKKDETEEKPAKPYYKKKKLKDDRSE